MRLSTLASLVKLEHTIFALPFAYVGVVLAAHVHDVDVWPWPAVWVTVAMVGARTLAMTLNRIVDAQIDARNPRTANREIPRGIVSRGAAIGVAVASLALLLVAVLQLDDAVHWLWPVPVAMFVVYPYTKRFTAACHLFLGATIGLAPFAAWLAVSGQVHAAALLLWLASGLWIAGFDVIYATADVEFDRAEGLHSLPADIGVGRALNVTRALHALCICALAAIGPVADLGAPYAVVVAAVAALLIWENTLVSADDLSRVDAAFFTVNGIVGAMFMAGVLIVVALS